MMTAECYRFLCLYIQKYNPLFFVFQKRLRDETVNLCLIIIIKIFYLLVTLKGL